MAAPTLTARQTPTGYKMPDGYQTLLAFASNPSLKVWERDVKPPGIDGGEAIDTTTMHNTVWRTRDARHLKTLTEHTVVAAYDPDVYTELLALVNAPTSITVHYPENSTLVYYGYVQKVDPAELKEGEMPLLTLTIVPTNWDPQNFVEAAPVFTPAAGT